MIRIALALICGAWASIASAQFLVAPSSGTAGDCLIVGSDRFHPSSTGCALKTQHFLTYQNETGLTNDINLGTLSSGLLKITVAGSAATPSTAVAGTDYVAPDAELTCLAGTTSAADKIPYYTGLGTCSTADFPSAARTFLTTPSSANWAALLSDETGTGFSVMSDSPALTTVLNLTATAAGVVSTLQSTDAGASQGPTLTIYRNSASPAVSDAISDINFDGKDSGGNQTTYAHIATTISSPTDTSESAIQSFQVLRSGTLATRASLTAGMTVGSAALNTNSGEIAMTKMVDAASAPTAGGAKLAVLCGTNAGTAKIVAYAGSSSTAVTVIDNVGAGVTGC